MADDYLLSKYYAAAHTPDSAARSSGATSGLAFAGVAAAQRKQKLQVAIASGKVKASDLGPVDAGLLGAVGAVKPPPQSSGGMGILGKVGGLFGNLGSDIGQAGKYFVSGLVHAGTSLYHDFAASKMPGYNAGTDSQFRRDIIDPTIADYKDRYGHGLGHFLSTSYQHPLAPILDLATVASLGGSAAARLGGVAVRSAEPGSALARLGQTGVGITSREGRAPFIHPVSGLETAREYTPRPVAKLGQRAVDALSKTGPEENRVGQFMRSMDDRKTARWNDAQVRALQHDVADAAMREIAPVAKLTPDEAVALTLAQKGINTPEKIVAFQKMVHDTSLDDHDALRALVNSTGVTEEYIRHLGVLPDHVKQKILQPNDRMIEAHQAWKGYVAKQQAEMGLTPEIVAGHLQTEAERLAPYLGSPIAPGTVRMYRGSNGTKANNLPAWMEDNKGLWFSQNRSFASKYGNITSVDVPEAVAKVSQVHPNEHVLPHEWASKAKPDPFGNPHSEYPIEHTYVPSEVAAGFKYHDPSGLARMTTGIEPAFRRGPTDTAAFTQKGTRYDQTLFVPKKPSHEYASTGETFASGALRTDARLYLDHVARRAREGAEEAWKRGEFNRIAARDADGKTLYFKNQDEVNAHFGRDAGMVFVNDQMPQIYFKKEYDAAQKFQAGIENYLKDAPKNGVLNPFNDPAVEQLLTNIVDADSKAFISSIWGTMKRPGGAVPKDQFEYRMRMAKASEPFTNPVMRFFSKWMYRWRTAVLTLMPRWGLNTALGSLLMNTIRGVNLKDYWIAQRLHGTGFLPDNLTSADQARALPTGARLGHQAQQELLEAVTPGHGQGRVANFAADLGIKVPTQKMANAVQSIENYFRQAQFIHNLRREHRLAKDGEGRTVDIGDDGSDLAMGSISNGLEQFYDGVLNGRGPYALDPKKSISEALLDPVVVERALKETDKMSYNYAVLGPAERRIVRQFIPFWGWYKFISMAAYRSAVDFPGRMNLIRNLSAIAAEDEKKYGPMPDWVKGSIPLGFGKDGKFKYLSTMGMNPFSTVFNPLGPQGALQGALTLGQFNPVVQAALQGFGIDPMTGQEVQISPETIGTDPFGKHWSVGPDGQPQQRAPSSISPLQRIFMGLLRSVPEYRIAERFNYGPQYPESIPFIPGAGRQMAPSKGGGYGDILLQMTGVAPKSNDVKSYGQFAPKMLKYSQKQQKTATSRLKRKINAGG